LRVPRWLVTFAILAGAASLGADQGAGAGSTPETARTKERPGLFRLGPLFLTPRLHVGTLGLDTNVFYTATDRRTDFTASGGPGLEVVLPIRSSVRLTAAGGVDYLYFLRTVSQRRLTGTGRAGLDWKGSRAEAGMGAAYLQSYSRPSLEVDQRVLQQQVQGQAGWSLSLGPRVHWTTDGTAGRFEVVGDARFRGVDLRRSLSHDSYVGRTAFGYRVTPKTSFLLEGDYQADRFLLDPARDADSDRLAGGFQIDSVTRLSGKAVGGVRSFRPRAAAAPERLVPYAHVDLTYRLGPRTQLGGGYERDLTYSALVTSPRAGMLTVETYRARLGKGLVGRLDLRLWGTLTRLRTDGPVAGLSGAPAVVRDDTGREAGADLGYTFRWRLRLGASASYVRRRSTIADFGIQGLLVGGTITYAPEAR
jgi:hypothetical protein